MIESGLIKEPAHPLFRAVENKKWTKDALSFNDLVTSWPDIVDAGQTSAERKPVATQGAFDYAEDDE